MPILRFARRLLVLVCAAATVAAIPVPRREASAFGVLEAQAYITSGYLAVLAAFLVTGGALAGLTSVMLVMLLGQTRVFFSMSKDGLLPQSFGKVHPTFRTPARITLVTGVVVMVALLMLTGMFVANIFGQWWLRQWEQQ